MQRQGDGVVGGARVRTGRPGVRPRVQLYPDRGPSRSGTGGGPFPQVHRRDHRPPGTRRRGGGCDLNWSSVGTGRVSGHSCGKVGPYDPLPVRVSCDPTARARLGPPSCRVWVWWVVTTGVFRRVVLVCLVATGVGRTNSGDSPGEWDCVTRFGRVSVSPVDAQGIRSGPPSTVGPGS